MRGNRIVRFILFLNIFLYALAPTHLFSGDSSYSAKKHDSLFLFKVHRILGASRKQSDIAKETHVQREEIPATSIESPTIAMAEEPFSEKITEDINLAGLSGLVGLELGINAYQVVLEPLHKTGLFAEVTYPVKKIWKRMGDRFEKGDPLIQLEDIVPRSNFEKAKAQLDQMSAKLEATSLLFQDNLSSLFELKEAEAETAKARAELTLAEKNLQATLIQAPYNGTIDTISIEEFELPQTSKELLKIIDDEVLIAKLLVPSYLVTKLCIGCGITIQISETNEVIDAQITRIGGMIDPASSTLKIEAAIDNRDRKFKAGMSGIARINLPGKGKDS